MTSTPLKAIALGLAAWALLAGLAVAVARLVIAGTAEPADPCPARTEFAEAEQRIRALMRQVDEGRYVDQARVHIDDLAVLAVDLNRRAALCSPVQVAERAGPRGQRAGSRRTEDGWRQPGPSGR